MTKSLLFAACLWLANATLVHAQIPAEPEVDGGAPAKGPDGGVPSPAEAPDAGSEPSAPSDGGVLPSADAGDAGVPSAAETDAAVEDPFGELAADAEPSAAPEVIAPEEALFRVDAVDVVAPRDKEIVEAPGSVYLLDQEQLEQLNFDDAHQVLSQIPGVYVRQEDGYGLRPNIGMRGADPDRSKKVTLMEDGVLFGPAPYSAPAAYYFPFMTRMVGVEVFKGAPAIRFGPQTIGGGLDLRTRETPYDGRVLGVDASGGNTFFTKLHAYGGYGTDRWGLLTEGAHLSSSGFKELDGGGDTGFSKQELMIKGRVNSDPAARIYQRLELKLGYSQEDSRETYLGLTDADFRENPLRRYAASRLDEMKFDRTQVELRHVLGIGEHFELTTVAYRHDFSRVWDRLDGLVNDTASEADDDDALRRPLKTITDFPAGSPTLIDYLRGDASAEDAMNARLLIASNDRRFVSQGVQSVARGDFKTGAFDHTLELGVRIHHDSIDRDHSATSYKLVDGLPEADGVKRPKLADNEITSVAFAAHLAYGITYGDLTLSPGMRTEIIRASYRERLEPLDDEERNDAGKRGRNDVEVFLFALGARYALLDELSLIAGVQQGMSPVAPDKTNINHKGTGVQQGMSPVAPDKTNINNKGSGVERAINYEAGLRFSDEQSDASMIGFVSDYEQVAVACGGECVGEEEGTSYFSKPALIYGVEWAASTRVTLPRAYGLPLRLAYTYTVAEFREGFRSSYEPWGGGDGEVDAGDAMPYVPPHQLSAGAGVDYRQKVGIDLNLTFMDRMREEAGQGPLETGKYTDRYAMLDAAAFYQILDNLRVYLKGDNLTNSQPIVSRRPFGARPNKPVLVQVGVKWEL